MEPRVLKFIFIFFICLIVLSAPAQKRLEGYIILNSGDTLKGEIRQPTARYLLYHQVIFWPAQEKRSYTFKPEELRGFGIGHVDFVSHYIWSEKKLVKKFLKILVRGNCTLYNYYYATRSARGHVSSPVLVYFLEQDNERLHAVEFEDLVNGKDLYFQADAALQQALLRGEYKKEDFPEIVKRFNEGRSVRK